MSCNQKTADNQSSRPDPTSLSNIDEVRITHLDLDLQVLFDSKQLTGSASLQIDNITDSDELILDTWGLTIHKVTLGEDEQETPYHLGEEVQYYGRPLTIQIQPSTKIVKVYYTTSPDAQALQWVEPEQTAQKTDPYLYSQSQFILARSWIPCQDSPGVRMTYNATIRTGPEYLALMSAENGQEKNDTGIYTFQMEQPIPSYLMALAVGDIEFRSISERAGIYAEPPVVDSAAWEFAETDEMIQAAEKLYGPYLWERYDMLVLPPSFPFGGMENPRLTFLTPTVLAGDRSLVALIAHELAHSWSGNLVTNATWDDFWLNEGFTTYFERRITEETRGRAYAQMLSELSYNSMLEEIERIGPDNSDTALKVDYAGRDPEEVFSSIPYLKGMFFLRMLEEHFGRERWDVFLAEYFDTFAFESMTTEHFVKYLEENLLNNDDSLKQELKIYEWIYEPGLPDNCPTVESEELKQVQSQIDAFADGTDPAQLKTEGWTTHHWLHFLRNIPDDLSGEKMQALDTAFELTDTGNLPILKEWLVLAVKNEYKPAYDRMRKYLVNVGRVSLIRDVYKELKKTEEGMELAKEIYKQAYPGYHSMARNAIRRTLES